MRSSIIIPNYNGMKYITKCIDSLMKEVDTTRDEIIVVDNGSTDGSAEFIRNNYPFVRLIRLSENLGFSCAVNAGIKNARSDYVILLNNDTEVEEQWLTSLIDAINKSPDIFSVSSKMMRYHQKDIIDDAGDGFTLFGWAYKRGDGKKVSYYNQFEQVFSSCAGAAIYRKSLIEKIGFFDERFFAYLEDVDIGFRAKIFGYKNFYCPNAIVYHIGSATSGGEMNSFKIRLSARNNFFVLYKNMPVLQLIFNLPFLIFGFLWRLMAYYRKGYGKDFALGMMDALKEYRMIDKIKYKNKHIWNYIRIEFELIHYTLKYINGKIL